MPSRIKNILLVAATFAFAVSLALVAPISTSDVVAQDNKGGEPSSQPASKPASKPASDKKKDDEEKDDEKKDDEGQPSE